ncbi:hypothetical protein ACFL2Q_07500 [Thermodesulfobacteriota bacterium]
MESRRRQTANKGGGVPLPVSFPGGMPPYLCWEVSHGARSSLTAQTGIDIVPVWGGRHMAKRRIRAVDLAGDVHAGINDVALMEKYGLERQQLQDLLKRLLEAGLITHLQLYERTSLSDSDIIRAFLEFPKDPGGLSPQG